MTEPNARDPRADATGVTVPTDRGTQDYRRAPRRRGAELRDAIFQATLSELAEVGYAELSMDGVACRGGVSKGSLYRRWSSRAELVVDAVYHGLPTPLGLADTGSVRTDILAFLRQFATVLNGPFGEAVRGLMAETIRDPELMAQVHARFIEPSNTLLLESLRKGVLRGEVRPTALTPLIATIGPALLRQQYLLHGAPLPDPQVIEIVDEVIMPLISA